jgi:formate dehydrogenase accessory protein FdhD
VIAPLSRHPALRITATARDAVEETLAEETPVALLFNGVPHVVMMCTPADLEDFALGFALSEGIVEQPAELQVIELLARERGLALHLAIPGARFDALERRRRNLVGRSGCGLCGAEALDDAIAPVRHVGADIGVAPRRLATAFAQLADRQPINRECGALHAAAALCGDTLTVREDVGRHNALDKAIGALARAGRCADALLVTSRASYELVHKAAQAGVGMLAAVSAPTSFAVRVAHEANLTLIGFAREGRMTIYAGAARVRDDDTRAPG